MAEGLLKQMLAAEGSADIAVSSYGIEANDGPVAAPNAIAALGHIGIDISGHQATKLSKEAVETADLIICMNKKHFAKIEADYPDALQKSQIVLGDGVSDPYGESLAVYITCRDQIKAGLQALLPAILAL